MMPLTHFKVRVRYTYGHHLGISSPWIHVRATTKEEAERIARDRVRKYVPPKDCVHGEPLRILSADAEVASLEEQKLLQGFGF